MSDREPEVWRQGFNAGRNGRAMERCPFKASDNFAAYLKWIQGWNEGRQHRPVLDAHIVRGEN